MRRKWERKKKSYFTVGFFFLGMSYVGHYVRDLRNGEGTLRWPNGDTFVGVRIAKIIKKNYLFKEKKLGVEKWWPIRSWHVYRACNK